MGYDGRDEVIFGWTVWGVGLYLILEMRYRDRVFLRFSRQILG
jgi:hypothetical protein